MADSLTDLHKLMSKWASAKFGEGALLIMAFADASFIPAPTTTFFLALVMINNNRALRYVLFGTLGTLLGSLAGYLAGHLVFANTGSEPAGLTYFLLNNIPGLSLDTLHKAELLYSKWGICLLFMAAATPIPFGAFAISSGAFSINIYMFFFATMLSWGLKFFVIQMVIIKLGNQIRNLRIRYYLTDNQ